MVLPPLMYHVKDTRHDPHSSHNIMDIRVTVSVFLPLPISSDRQTSQQEVNIFCISRLYYPTWPPRFKGTLSQVDQQFRGRLPSVRMVPSYPTIIHVARKAFLSKLLLSYAYIDVGMLILGCKATAG